MRIRPRSTSLFSSAEPNTIRFDDGWTKSGFESNVELNIKPNLHNSLVHDVFNRIECVKWVEVFKNLKCCLT